MRTTADAVVVGGGAIGASTLFHLASLGLTNVVLCERRILAGEATGSSAAHVQVGHNPETEARLVVASLPYYLHWDELVGAGSSGFVQTGYLRFGPPEALGEAREKAEAARSLGVDAYVLDPQELRELAPYLATSDLTYAHHQPLAGHASGSAMTFGFADRATQLGAEIHERTPVIAIETSGGRVTGVRTATGTIATELVIVAAGAWTGALLRALGVDLPVAPHRTQVAAFEWSASATPIRFMSVNDDLNLTYFSYEGPDARHVIVGSNHRPGVAPRPGVAARTPLTDLEGYDREGDPAYQLRAREAFVARVPAAAYIRPAGGWGGPITITPDRRPIVDAAPGITGLLFATGCNGGGLKHSPALGKCLAEWAVFGAPRTVDLAPFAAARFAPALTT